MENCWLLYYYLLAVTSFGVVVVSDEQADKSSPPPVFMPIDEKLKRDLTVKCSLDTKTRPISNITKPINVTVAFFAFNFLELNDHDET